MYIAMDFYQGCFTVKGVAAALFCLWLYYQLMMDFEELSTHFIQFSLTFLPNGPINIKAAE